MDAKLDLDRIERDAKAATPGPYLLHPEKPRVIVSAGNADLSLLGTDLDGWGIVWRKENAVHLANCDPATVMALCEDSRRVEKVEKMLSVLAAEVRTHHAAVKCNCPIDEATWSVLAAMEEK